MNIFNQQVAIFKKIAILIVPIVVLWGCESTPDKDADAGAADTVKVDSGAKPSGMDQDAGATARPMTEAKKHPLDDPSSMLADRTIYFDFDKNDIKDEFRDVIKAHADFLSSNPSANVSIEGHADERGTREYNIGLGDRRANAVRQLLVLQGASSGQVDTISYGEERPAALGHDESSWSQNRRAEIVYTSR